MMSGQVKKHPLFARFYVKCAGPAMTQAGIDTYRQRLLAGLSGSVLEIGPGYGANFAFYPPEVTEVTGVEPEPQLRALAEASAAKSTIPITVKTVAAEELPFLDDTFDAAVACLVLCSVADPAASLAEIRRVLKPGAPLRFFEHIRAPSPGMRRVQKVLDATLWPPLMGGCHTGRDTVSALTAAGFTVAELETFAFPKSAIPTPANHCALGTAIASPAV